MSETNHGGGCNIHGPFEVSGHTTETCPDAANTAGAENKEGGEVGVDLSLDLGDSLPNITVDIDSDGNVTNVVKDIKSEGFSGIDQEAFDKMLKPFYDAGLKEGSDIISVPWSQGDDGSDWDGSLEIKKDAINTAITNKKLRIKKNSTGDLEVVAI